MTDQDGYLAWLTNDSSQLTNGQNTHRVPNNLFGFVYGSMGDDRPTLTKEQDDASQRQEQEAVRIG